MEKNFNRQDFMIALNKAKRLTTEQFIEKAKQIYGDRFDYSKTEYLNATTKLTITCREHGDFIVLPHHHIRKDDSAKTGCRYCGKAAINRDRRFTQEQFLERVKDIKGVSFEKSVYKDKRSRIIATCEIHGDYETTAEVSLKGHGCPKCKNSLGEAIIRDLLKSLDIEFIQQKGFEGLSFKRQLKFDFYLIKYNSCIEFDGEQHFKSVEYWKGEEGFKRLQIKDALKNTYCQVNNIPLLRVRFNDTDIVKTVKDFLDSLSQVL